MRRVGLALAILAAASAWALVDRSAGVPTWRDLSRQLDGARERTTALRAEVSVLERDAHALEVDPLAIEAAIRTDLGFARPGETIVRAVPPEVASDESLTR